MKLAFKEIIKKRAPRGRHAAGEKKRPRLKRFILLAVLLAVLAGGGWWCYTLFFTQEEQVALTDFTTEGSLTQSIEGTGTTEPADSVTYSPASMDSEILEVCVQAGDTVRAGDVLFRQDDSEVDELIEGYRDEINDYELELQDYNEQLSELSEALGNLVVCAPFSGRISDVAVEAGDDVTSGTRLCVITDDSTLELVQYFSYAYEAQISVGMEAVVSVSEQMLSLTGRVADVRKVEYITAEGMSCFEVTVAVSNPGSLTEGTAAGSYLVAADGTEIYPAVDGTLACAAAKTITARAGGEISSCRACNYGWVNKGQTLFVISSDSYSTQMESVNRQIERLEDKITALNESIDEAEDSRENYCRTSEIDGTVISCTLTEGLSRMIAMQSVTVYSMEVMTISVNIDELDAEKVYEGQSVSVIRSGAEQDTEYEAHVSYMSLEASSSNGVATFPCTITIESAGALTSGVNVSYVISIGDDEQGVLAPIAALKSTDEGTCLFVKADERPDNAIELENVDVPSGFYAVPVEVGASNESYARILSGVESGAEVFTRYRQTAPSGGGSTSENPGGGDNAQTMPDFSGGSMPDFSGGGGMPGAMGGGMPG